LQEFFCSRLIPQCYLYSISAQYDECIRRLQIAEAGSPAGRSFHACYGSGDQLRVFDVWDSMKYFEKFGANIDANFERYWH